MMELAAFIWAGIATIGAVAAAFTRWRSASTETVSVLWREEAEAQKARADRLETTVNELSRRMDALEAENKSLRTLHDTRDEMAALRSAVTAGLADLHNLLNAFLQER